jgi:hypothetical protein
MILARRLGVAAMGRRLAAGEMSLARLPGEVGMATKAACEEEVTALPV